ncbi:C39 family peptidase [Microbacterium sp. BWT-B31]|uniref:C39 family peptidase n=1 Tax=Microbacterium sp. BWT-B31 TaxID=3232072 RepID=UPI0035299260
MHAPSPADSPAGAPAWHTRLVRADTTSGWTGRQWTSGALEARLPLGTCPDEAIASWNLEPGIPARIEIRARAVDGDWHPWQELAWWGPPGDRRSPASPDPADHATHEPIVDTDILTTRAGGRWDGVQLRITLAGDATASAHPLRLAAVSFSAPGAAPDPAEDGEGTNTAVAVQPLSQRAYPARDDLGGGGPSWCSPTALTMVASTLGARIPDAASADVPDGADARVPWVARAVYDSSFDGTGNWSFNAAVAGELGLDAVVTRLSSLHDAAVLTGSGIPLIASISFGAGELPGADYATAGHLLVIRGFDRRGDVLAADPANPGGAAGLRTYPRAAFDMAWSHSRRTVYLITPHGHRLPPPSATAAW